MDELKKIHKECYLFSEGSKSLPLKVFFNFFSSYYDIPTQVKSEYQSEISEIFLGIIQRVNYDEIFELRSENIITYNTFVLDFSDIIIASTSGEMASHPDSSTAFLFFLRGLLPIGAGSKSEINSGELYKCFSDIIDNCTWIFKLLDENGDKKFKLSSILDDAIATFKFDPEHLLKLLISLHVFNSANESIGESRAKDKILEIASDHKIEILNWLCANGNLIFDSRVQANYFNNNVFICKNGSKVLIRSENKEYFRGHNDIKEECDANGDVFAYYVIEQHDEMVIFASIQYAFSILNKTNRLRLLNKIFLTGNFNVFFSNLLILKGCEFIGFTNPFGVNDNNIITNNGVFDLNFMGFYNAIMNEYTFLRQYGLFESNIVNIVTVDFVLSFLSSIEFKNITFFNIFCEHVFNNDEMFSNDFAQNCFLKIFFENIPDDIAELNSFLFLFFKNFISEKFFCNNFELLSKNKHSHNNRLIFPVKFYFPFNCEFDILQYLYQKLNQKFQCTDFHITQIKSKVVAGQRKYIIGDETDLSSLKLKNFDSELIEITPEMMNKSFFFSRTMNIVVHDDIFDEILNTCKKIFSLRDKLIIKFEDYGSDEYYNHIISILNIISKCGFPLKILTFFGVNSKKYYNYVALYKLFWHFNVFMIDSSKFKEFKNLVLEMHFTDFMYNEGIQTEFFEKLEVLNASLENAVFISKNDASESSTLDNVLSSFPNLERNMYNLSTTKQGVEKQVEKINNQGFKPANVVFLTDNFISGSSTKKMLRYYIHNVRSSNYNFIEFECSLINFFDVDCLNYSILSMYGCKKGESKIQEEYNNVTINVLHYIDSDKFSFNDEIRNTILSLYNYEHRDTFSCVCYFRPINMPALNAFPPDILDAYNIVGLFQRREEHSAR